MPQAEVSGDAASIAVGHVHSDEGRRAFNDDSAVPLADVRVGKSEVRRAEVSGDTASFAIISGRSGVGRHTFDARSSAPSVLVPHDNGLRQHAESYIHRK